MNIALPTRYKITPPHLPHTLKENYPGIAMGLREERLLYREWLRALMAHISDPLLMVLDGLDRLTPEAASYLLIEALIETVPPNIRLILTSRETPPIDIQKLNISQKIYILENEDLAFTEAEVESFFMHVRKTPLEKWEIHQAHQITEGWIGGLILLSTKLGRLSSEERARVLSGDYLSRFKEEVFQYLEEMIFSSFSPQLQDLLIKASLFDAIDPTFLQQLFNVPEAESIFLELNRKNLFVHRTFSTDGRQVFRYHQLFRDFLKRKFERRNNDKVKRALLVEAGDLFFKRETEEEALRCYLEARAYDRALPLFEKIGTRLLERGQQAELLRLVRTFPEVMVAKSPWLLFYLSMTRRFSDATENLKTLQQALSLFEEKKETRGQLLALAYLIEASIIAGHDDTPLAVLLEKAEVLLNKAPTDHYAYELATLWFLMGFGTTIRGGNPRKGFWACQNAAVLAGKTGNEVLRTQALIQSMQALSWLGEFALCDQICAEIEPIIDRLGNPELQAIYLTARAALISGRGQSDEGETLLLKAQENITSHGLIYLYPQTLLYQLLFDPLKGRYDEAETLGNQLFQLASSINAIFFQGIARFLLGLNAYHQGRFAEAMHRVQNAAETFSQKNARSEFHIHWTALMKGLLAYHLTADDSIRTDLDHAASYYQRTSNHIFLAHARFVQALLFDKEQLKEEARQKLDQGFRIVNEQSYDYFSFLSYSDFTRICALAVELKSSEGQVRAPEFLKTRLAPWAENELLRLDAHSDTKVQKMAFDIRRDIHRSGVPL
ncbi:MAG: hypothetical protein P8165_17615, partial [Deltaproteobacteria bacterium]